MTTEMLHPGRRLVLHLPISHCDAVTIAVLDSEVEDGDEVSCAAILVPRGEERSWIYTSKGGQWQLLAIAAVARLIVVTRANSTSTSGDEALKARLRSVVVALAPRVCFRDGPPAVPFVEYSDNVIRRVVVEEIFSSQTGFMVVEDVALHDSVIESGEAEYDRVVYRRRLRFKRMPNLIQTEVALIVPQKVAIEGPRVDDVSSFSKSRIDHGWLVHKYLPPIVAGLVLAAPCIEPCMESRDRVKILTLGVGGGALPMFLHKHLGFCVQAVDVDEVVLDVAHRHFGLENGVDMEVIAGDALKFVHDLAMNVRAEGDVSALIPSNPPSEKLANASPHTFASAVEGEVNPAQPCSDRYPPEGEDNLAQPCSDRYAADHLSSSCVDTCQERGGLDKHRVHAIIVDVDEGDPRCGLSSPPSSFLHHEFLTDVRALLHDGGLLAMNVVPNGTKSYHGVVASLLSVFDDVYETGVEGDVNRVVFALSSVKSTLGVNLNGPLASLVRRFLDVRLISGIQKACVEI